MQLAPGRIVNKSAIRTLTSIPGPGVDPGIPKIGQHFVQRPRPLGPLLRSSGIPFRDIIKFLVTLGGEAPKVVIFLSLNPHTF